MKGDHNEDQGSTAKFKGAGDRYGVWYDLHGLQRPGISFHVQVRR